MKNSKVISTYQRTWLDQLFMGLFLGFLLFVLFMGVTAAVKNVNYFTLSIGLGLWAIISFYCYRAYAIPFWLIAKNSLNIIAMCFLLLGTGIAKEELGYFFAQDNTWQGDYVRYFIYTVFNIVPIVFPLLASFFVFIEARHLSRTVNKQIKVITT